MTAPDLMPRSASSNDIKLVWPPFILDGHALEQFVAEYVGRLWPMIMQSPPLPHKAPPLPGP